MKKKIGTIAVLFTALGLILSLLILKKVGDVENPFDFFDLNEDIDEELF